MNSGLIFPTQSGSAAVRCQCCAAFASLEGFLADVAQGAVFIVVHDAANQPHHGRVVEAGRHRAEWLIARPG